MKLLLFLFISSTSLVYSQGLSKNQLDSLFNLYTGIKVNRPTDAPVTYESYEKCGFGIVNRIHSNFDKFTPEQQNVIQEILIPPVLQTNVLTPSGIFRVHYDTSGINSIKYNLNLLLQAIDSTYNYEVKYLDYPPPPAGTDGLYNIYIQNTGNLYGYTETGPVVDGKLTSFIVLDNDFASTATKGIDGARVTIAHEMHHAIQIGNYKFAEDDIFFHELTSTAMEEFVYDTINDYYYYMDDYFNNADETFPSHTGYDLAIWNIYLKSEYGFGILKEQWELIRQHRALDAMAISLTNNGENFQEAFNKFGIWVYFTSYRKQSGKYFEEAEFYPPAKNLMVKMFTPPSDSITLYAEPLTHNFFTMYDSDKDSLTVVISNSDYKSAITSPGILQYALYEISVDSSEGMNYLADGLYQSLSTGTSGVFWATSEFLNNQLIREGYITLEAESPFPSPFRYSKHSFIYFPVIKNPDNEVELNIFSASMDLIYSGRKTISLVYGKDIVTWDVKSLESQKLGSGIYFYVIKSGEDISKGKIVVFND